MKLAICLSATTGSTWCCLLFHEEPTKIYTNTHIHPPMLHCVSFFSYWLPLVACCFWWKSAQLHQGPLHAIQGTMALSLPQRSHQISIVEGHKYQGTGCDKPWKTNKYSNFSKYPETAIDWERSRTLGSWKSYSMPPGIEYDWVTDWY